MITDNPGFEKILSYLPQKVKNEAQKYRADSICEIRLRAGRPMSITSLSANIPCSVICSAEEISETVYNMCGGSLHSYSDTLKNGYIPLDNGCRVGVCGTLSGGNVRDITSLCIRIPRSVKGIGASVCRRLASSHGGIMIYSPPGEGKTTLLRDIASTISSPPYNMRVSVIDTRREIYRPDVFSASAADIYLAYPKSVGIELATRTMSPQYIFCDELGEDEAEAVLSSQNCGVPLVATAHADSLSSLLARKAMKKLDETGAFECYIGIKRDSFGTSDRRGFIFDITERSKT